MSDCSPDNSVLPPWEDADVQLVYKMLCDPDLNEPPNREEHWEGWISRNIVAALRAGVAQSTVPDAWQFRFKRWNGEWSDWQTLHGGDEGYRNPDYEYRPLFASPVSSTHQGKD